MQKHYRNATYDLRQQIQQCVEISPIVEMTIISISQLDVCDVDFNFAPRLQAGDIE